MAAETITEDLGVAPKPASAKKSSTKSASSAKKKATATRSKRTAKSSKTSRASKSTKSVDTMADPGSLALPRELGGLVSLALALTLMLAILSFQPADMAEGAKVQNLIGPVGANLANWLLTIFGLGAFCFDALLWYLGFAILVGKRPEWRPLESVGQLFFVLTGTMLAHLMLANYLFFGHAAGGFVGQLGAEIMRGFFGTVGAYILTLSLLMMSVMFITDISLGTIVRAFVAQVHKTFAYAKHRWRVHLEYQSRLKEERQRLLAEQGTDSLEDQARHAAELSLTPLTQKSYDFEDNFEHDVEQRLSARLGRLFKGSAQQKIADAKKKKHSKKSKAVAADVDAPDEELRTTQPRINRRNALVDVDDNQEESESWVLDQIGDAHPSSEPAFVQVDDGSSSTLMVDDEDLLDSSTIVQSSTDDDSKNRTIVQKSSKKSAPTESIDADAEDGDGPRIVKNEAADRAKRVKELLSQEDGEGVLFKPQKRGDFELPAISFLNYEDNNEDSVDIEELRRMAAQIEKTLNDFKVQGQIKDICPGPVITVFEFSPAPGVKISKIANLADDLAMALAALSVRIVAPIPGKGVVGIEVPNPSREIVYMKEIIADKVFYENKKMTLPMGLGKDTSGNPVVTDLAKMPHLLVAGATGSGKSVAVNTMITSLLYKNSPDDVRLIMVDPKMLEFSIYADIPHLLLPVVTDPRQATVALNWAVQEMERRYQKLADLNVRNIKGYNTKVAKLTEQAELDLAEGKDDTKAIRSLALDEQGKPEHVHLPYIVVIIDEFADLMMTASKDVETAVARLAQKARAAGLHLILATQRPSTDVITGLIKANFPTRIALRVTSKTDSRVILDSNGAENLLGNGDMLFVPPGTSHVQRVHGAYVSEKEIELMVDFLKEQGEPQYNEDILKEEEEGAGEEEEELDYDEYYQDAVRLVVESNQASISMIQRKLRVGYNRAARMVEVMEKEGLVSAPDGCKPREVLVDVSPF